MGGVRRQTHWDNARDQGVIAGANMTGKKRIRYEQIPYFWTEMFDLHMDCVGDFSVLPTRIDLRGAYAKKKFVVRYYQGEKLRAILLCQQTPRDVEAAKRNCAALCGNGEGTGLARNPRLSILSFADLSVEVGVSECGNCVASLIRAGWAGATSSNGVASELTRRLSDSIISLSAPSIQILPFHSARRRSTRTVTLNALTLIPRTWRKPSRMRSRTRARSSPH